MEANFHALRHRGASFLSDLGTDLTVIRDILVHRSVRATKRYAHLDDVTRLRAGAAGLGKILRFAPQSTPGTLPGLKQLP
ncbi:MAG: tyrosine-type recombinase/integrase [Betaproteobacteria bacterium]|nr:tyrosine-type recombinase/integrase [Betaproteobacteria bacterium]